MASRKPTAKKRQVKLSFSPVAPASRLAHVSYEGSPAKRRRIEDYLQDVAVRSDGPSSSAALAASQQQESLLPASPPPPSLSSSRWPVKDTMSTAGKKQKQSRDKPSRHRQRDDIIASVIERGRNTGSSDSSSMPSAVSSSSSDELVIRTPKAKQDVAKKGKKSRRSAPESSQVFSLPPPISPTDQSGHGSSLGKAPEVIRLSSSEDDVSPSDEDSSDSDDKPLTSARRKLFAQSSPATKLDDGSDSGGEIRSSARRSSQRNKKATKPSKKQNDDDHDNSNDSYNGDDNNDNDDDDDDDVAPRSSRQRRQTIPRNGARDRQDDESDALPVSSQRRTRAGMKKSANQEQDAAPSSSARRSARIQRGRTADYSRDPLGMATGESDSESDAKSSESLGNARKAYEQDKQNEIDEDAEDLKSSTVFRDDDTRDKTSTRDRRRSRLEELKAKRDGRASSPVNISDSDEQGGDQGADDQDEEDVHPLAHDESDLDDFIVDLEDGEGGDDTGLMDLQVMRHGQLKLKEHWEYTIRWMLTQRLNPGGAAELQDFYRVSLDRVNNECRGLVARLISSAWTATFTNALRARPEYEETQLDYIAGNDYGKCSACNRSGHPARFMVRLTGKAYSRQTLEPLKDEEEDDEDSYDEFGHKLLEEGREFMLGTHCRSNAMNAHALLHWRMRLRDWINIYLRQNGHLKSRRIVEREAWPTARRARLVDDIVARLREAGAVRELWREFDEKLAAAPNVQGQRAWK